MALFNSTTTDILAAKLKTSSLPRETQIMISEWLIHVISEINPRFDRLRFLKLSGLMEPRSAQYIEPPNTIGPKV